MKLITLLFVCLFINAAHFSKAGGVDGGGGGAFIPEGGKPVLLDFALVKMDFNKTYEDQPLKIKGLTPLRPIDLAAGQRLYKKLQSENDHVANLILSGLENLVFYFSPKSVPTSVHNDKINIDHLPKGEVKGFGFYINDLGSAVNVNIWNEVDDLSREGLILKESLRYIQINMLSLSDIELIYRLGPDYLLGLGTTENNKFDFSKYLSGNAKEKFEKYFENINFLKNKVDLDYQNIKNDFCSLINSFSIRQGVRIEVSKLLNDEQIEANKQICDTNEYNLEKLPNDKNRYNIQSNVIKYILDISFTLSQSGYFTIEKRDAFANLVSWAYYTKDKINELTWSLYKLSQKDWLLKEISLKRTVNDRLKKGTTSIAKPQEEISKILERLSRYANDKNYKKSLTRETQMELEIAMAEVRRALGNLN